MMSGQKLAIDGGPPAVTSRYRDRWRRMRYRDLMPLLRYTRRDVSTIPNGSGPIARFESRFAEMAATKYALAMNTGTAALHSAYLAVGVGPGTEVIVPSYTWFASATPILQCGGRPVFCDIDPRTLTADPDDVERRITPKTRALCVVHVWGNPAAMDRFVDIAKRHHVALIEDASHAPGATYQDRPVGSWGDVGCFSLQGVKAVSGGELGIAVTDDPVLFDRMLVLAHNGRTANGQAADTFEIDNISLGLKYRPHLFAILLATASLSRLPRLNTLRRRNYEILSAALRSCPAIKPIETYPGAVRGGLLEFVFEFQPEHAGGLDRDMLIHHAKAEGVPVAHDRYTKMGRTWRTLHECPVFARPGFPGLGGFLGGCADTQGEPRRSLESLPAVERLSDRLIRLPPFTRVPERFVRQCAAGLRKVVERA